MLQAETATGTCTLPVWAVAFIHPCMIGSHGAPESVLCAHTRLHEKCPQMVFPTSCHSIVFCFFFPLLIVYLSYERSLWFYADDASVTATFHSLLQFVLFVCCWCEDKELLMLKKHDLHVCKNTYLRIPILISLLSQFCLIGPNIPSCFEVAVKL